MFYKLIEQIIHAKESQNYRYCKDGWCFKRNSRQGTSQPEERNGGGPIAMNVFWMK